MTQAGSPDPRLDRFLHYVTVTPPNSKLLASVALGSERFRSPIAPARFQERPGNTGVLVGQGNGRDLGRLAGDDVGKPWIWHATPLGMAETVVAPAASSHLR